VRSLLHSNFISITLIVHPHERMYWNPKELPLNLLDTPEKNVEFWTGVKYWCEDVLLSRFVDILFGVSGTGGGVGLAATHSCNAYVVAENVTGLLEVCSREQSDALRTVFKFSSLYQSRENSKSGLVQILYGPASLLNNDNGSMFTFIDKKYLTNSTIKWKIRRQLLVGHNNWEVMFLHRVKGVSLHPCRLYCFQAGEQIFVNYQDPNYVDLTYDTSDEENATLCTPARKRLRFEYQHDSVYTATRVSSSGSGSGSGSGSSFDFASSSSSQGSQKSDSTYTGSSTDSVIC